MFTPTHGCLALMFSLTRRRQWSNKEHLWFFLGSTVPDIPAIIVGGRECLKCKDILFADGYEAFKGAIWTNVGYYRTFIFCRELLHNFWFWGILLVLAWFLRNKLFFRRRIRPLAYGAIFFHIFVDWPTHLLPVHNYFRPLTHHPQIGFVSHTNAALWLVEIMIMLCACRFFREAKPIFWPEFLAKKGAVL